MSIFSQHAIDRAAAALNELSLEQRHALTLAWINDMAPTALCLDPKLVALAMAVCDYYSDATFAELQAMRNADHATVAELRAQLAAVKHELDVAHRYAELLDAKNGVLRSSMAHTENVARHVDTDFVEMRDALATQF